jgi:hypothetical protein
VLEGAVVSPLDRELARTLLVARRPPLVTLRVVLDLKRTRAANEVAANAIEHGSRPGDEIEICRTLRRDHLSGSACRDLRERRQTG